MPKSKNAITFLTRATIILALLMGWIAQFPELRARAYGGGYALQFDGVDDYIQVSSTTRAQFILGSNWASSKSVSMWVRPTASAPIVSNPTAGDLLAGNMSPRWWGISHANVAALGGDKIWVFNWDSTINWQTIGIDYTLGEWVHIALVHDGINLSAYRNGVLVGSVPSGPTFVPNINGAGYLFIGGSNTDLTPGNFIRFTGQIDEVGHWDVPLSETVIRELLYREIVATHPNWGNLKVYYSMTNGSGSTVTDDSANSWDGTVAGNAAWIASGAFAGPRNGLDFDGVDDYAVIAPGFNLPGNLTMEAWIYPRDLSSGQKWIAGENGGAQLTMDGSQVQFRIHDGTSLSSPATAVLTANQWQHVAGTYDGANLEIYVNGNLGAGVNHIGSNQDQASDFTIASADGSSQFNNALLDEVRVWSAARSASQIQQNMFQTLAGNESGLLAYYRFDQYNASNQTILYDITDNNHDGSLAAGMDPMTDWAASTAFNTWIGGDSADAASPGNWSRNTVPTGSDNVGIFNYPGSYLPSTSSPFSVQNLAITAGSTLSFVSGAGLTVSGVIHNYGSLQQTLPVSGSGPVPFIGTGAYGGVIIDPNGQDLGDTTIVIQGNQQCTNITGETVQRCFDIASTSTPTNATVTFYYNAGEETPGNVCNTLQTYHWEGSWVQETLDNTYGVAGRDCAATLRSLRVTGVDAFSPFILASPPDPTAISLVSFGTVARNPAAEGLMLWALARLVVLSLGLVVKFRRS